MSLHYSFSSSLYIRYMNGRILIGNETWGVSYYELKSYYLCGCTLRYYLTMNHTTFNFCQLTDSLKLFWLIIKIYNLQLIFKFVYRKSKTA